MAYEIIWLPKAEDRFDEIIEYLKEHWDDKTVSSFIKKTAEKLSQISDRPKMFRRSEQRWASTKWQ
jgi:plasmid stabilization system protein ParE